MIFLLLVVNTLQTPDSQKTTFTPELFGLLGVTDFTPSTIDDNDYEVNKKN